MLPFRVVLWKRGELSMVAVPIALLPQRAVAVCTLSLVRADLRGLLSITVGVTLC
jgi:hypothetical protein